MYLLHANFEAESGTACSVQTIRRNTLYYVIKPRSTAFKVAREEALVDLKVAIFELTGVKMPKCYSQE